MARAQRIIVGGGDDGSFFHNPAAVMLRAD
jgi:hypothetical protein